jgi:hypothetical protein
MRETIKDGSGKVVGYKMKQGSQTLVQDASGNLKGRYDENTRQTYDKSGHARFKGDETDMLLGEESTD